MKTEGQIPNIIRQLEIREKQIDRLQHKINDLVRFINIIDDQSNFFDSFCTCNYDSIMPGSSHDPECMVVKIRKDYDELMGDG